MMKTDEFGFTCPKCGEDAVFSIQHVMSNEIPNPELPAGIRNKIDRMSGLPDIKIVNDRPVIWISYKLGFLGSKKRARKTGGGKNA